MNKIQLNNWVVESNWLQLLSTNFRWLFMSIQGDVKNRSIVILSDEKNYTSNISKNLLEKIENSNINIPEWFNLIWILSNWTYINWDFISKKHYYKKVDEDYRWIWIWTLMLDVKESLDWILGEEYSRKISWISFLLRNWFKINWKVNNKWESSTLTKKEESELYSDLSKFINKDIDDKILEYTIIFKRKLEKI